MARDRRLQRYRDKRNFERTPEPRGDDRPPRPESRPRFVIQEHHARRLHYDVRLEVDGVLKSWAVPKGPSADPRERRLAVQTEDHPLAYCDFEGVIPAGEYGAGVMTVWDAGTYENLSEKDGEPIAMAAAIERGRVRIRLHGKRVQGGWALVRTGGPASADERRWLMIKMIDAYAERSAPRDD